MIHSNCCFSNMFPLSRSSSSSKTQYFVDIFAWHIAQGFPSSKSLHILFIIFFSQIAWFPIKDPRKSITELKWTVAFACIQIRVITCYIHSLLYSDLTFPPLWTTCACLCSQPTKNTRIFFRTLQSKITILTAVVAFFLCKLEWIPCFSEQFCVSVWSIHLLAIKMTGVYIYVNSYLHNFTIVFQFNVLFFNRI